VHVLLCSAVEKKVHNTYSIATPHILSRTYIIGRWLSFLLGLLTCEDGTDTLSRNVGKQLPHDAA
jgi:hypothetical protein